jgi:hypothetical protein
MKAFWKGLSRKAKTYIITGSAGLLLLIIIVASCSGGGGSAALSPRTASYQQLCQAAVGQSYEGNTITAVQPYAYEGNTPTWNQQQNVFFTNNGGVRTECEIATNNGDYPSGEYIEVTLSPDGKVSVS